MNQVEQSNVLKIVRKSNELVEGKYKFDIWETRVFTKMLTMIKKNDEDFQEYRIYLKDVVSEFGLESQKGSYERLKEGALKLMDKTVKILRDTDEGVKEFYTNIVAGVEALQGNSKNKDEARYIDISFHPKMKPCLLQLKSQFTTYDVRNILNLPSTYSIRIYEILKQYETIGKREISIVELKEIVGVIEEIRQGNKIVRKDRYPLYGNFRQRVLLQAQKDLINNTDISFTFEPIKRGRKYHRIIFYISKNRPRRNKKPQGEQKNHIYEIIKPKTKHWKQGIDRELITKLLNKGATDENLIEAVTYTNNRIESEKEIESEVAYFVKMANEAMKQGNLFDPVQDKKDKKKQREAKRKERVRKENELQELIAEKNKKASDINSEKLVYIEENEPEVLQEAIKKVKAMGRAWNDQKPREENLKNPMTRSLTIARLKEMKPELFEESKKLQEEVKKLEKTKRNL